jgi:hypothetical protein
MCNPSVDVNCLAALATFLSAMTSVIAAIITAWMAIETRRMAIATNRSVNLQYQPMLGIRSVIAELSIQSSKAPQESQSVSLINIGLELHNAGHVELTYFMKYMRVSFANRTSDDGEWISRSGMILPGSSTFFYHPSIILDPPVEESPARGKIQALFEYYSDEPDQRRRLPANLEYTIVWGSNGSRVNWIFIDVPSQEISNSL